MRIGLIAPPWMLVPPSGYGGIEEQIHHLATGLRDAGHDVVLAAAAGSTCPVELRPGAPPASDVAIGDGVTELAHVLTAYEAIVDVDLVHDHTVAGALVRRADRDPRVVVTCHGPIQGPLRTVYRAIADAAALVAISAAQAASAPDVRFARVIHHGLDVSAVPVGTGDGGYACFLGRVSPEKGLREAILIARRAGIPLKIAAKMRDRSEREYFDECVRPLLGPDVEWLGEADTATKFRLLGGALALLNPIRWQEPFGLVMIEALATGTPVIGTPNGSAPEIVEDGVTGFLRRLHELPEALRRAADLDRHACRRSAETRFSAERMVRDHLALYRDLLDATRDGRHGLAERTMPMSRLPIPAHVRRLTTGPRALPRPSRPA